MTYLVLGNTYDGGKLEHRKGVYDSDTVWELSVHEAMPDGTDQATVRLTQEEALKLYFFLHIRFSRTYGET